MPQYNSYPVITELLADDVLLVWQDSSSANKNIDFSDLVDSVNTLLPKTNTVTEVSSNVTLDEEYQTVVGNSGGTFTITLPAASAYEGKPYRIGNKGAGTITVQTTGSDEIAGNGVSGSTSTIEQYYAFDFESDGVDTWFMIGSS
jgi:hypothetical protein